MFKFSKDKDNDGALRTLYLLRHAEAENGSPDPERKLTPAGKAAARKLGLTMRERKYKPDQILCSTARRTKETLGELNLFAKVEYRDEIYGATPEQLFALLQQAGKGPSLLLVGHNPAIHALAVALAGQGDPNLLRGLHAAYPPATLAVLTFTGAWSKLTPHASTVSSLVLS